MELRAHRRDGSGDVRQVSHVQVPMNQFLAVVRQEGVRVFGMLFDGKTVVATIIATKIHPFVVNLIAADYARLTGGILVRKDTGDKNNELLRRAAYPGELPIQSGEALIEATKFCIDQRACSLCRAQSRVALCADGLSLAASAAPP